MKNTTPGDVFNIASQDRLYAKITVGRDKRWHQGERFDVPIWNEPAIVICGETLQHDTGMFLVLTPEHMGWMRR